jgi:hypothetical protein
VRFGRRHTRREIVKVLLRRRWLVLLPIAMGLIIPWPINETAWLRQAIATAVTGSLFGLALVALSEYRGAGLAREEDVTRALMLPVLGTVSVLKTERERRLQRLRRVALDVIGCLILTSAVLMVLWRLSSVE